VIEIGDFVGVVIANFWRVAWIRVDDFAVEGLEFIFPCNLTFVFQSDIDLFKGLDPVEVLFILE